MRTDGVIFFEPHFRNIADFLQGLEHMGIENFKAKSSVEPFDIGILGRLAWLNEIQLNRMLLGPVGQVSSNEFRTIVDPQPLRIAPPTGEHVQDSGDPLRWQGGINLNPEGLAVEIIENV